MVYKQIIGLMMWAATVRRCPSGHTRHPSQFGARLQLARALNHAPYLICDGVYHCPASRHPRPETLEPDPDDPYMPRLSPIDDSVQLPYTRRDATSEDRYQPHIIRRYDNIPNVPEDDSMVGLSYQQRSIDAPYGGDLWSSELAMDCWGGPLLLKRSVPREIVKTLSVVGISLTLIICVVMAFGVHNILVTGLFLVLLLLTVSLVIFLFMRKPTCFACCRDSMDMPAQDSSQPDFSPFLSDNANGVMKQRLTDSPPPYESPPDYDSLPPELLVTPRNLDFDASDGLAPVHYNDHYIKHNCRVVYKERRSVLSNLTSSKVKACPQRNLISQSSPLIHHTKFDNCSTNNILESSKPPETGDPLTPPPYDCVVKIPDDIKDLKRH